jgi:hypothetical protein
MYEFILLKGEGAMHSSTGTALSAEEMLKMTPPEVLRFLILKNQPNKHIVFDSGLGFIDLVDEYDKEERVYFGLEEESKGMKDLKKTYELSQPYHVPKTVPHQIPYRHLVTIIQIGQKWDGVKNILLRTKQIPKDLKKEDEERITAAFKKTIAVRIKGPEAKELADNYFFETLVRIHRAGEGASYAGLKNEPAEPIIMMSEKALETGMVDSVANKVAAHVKKGIKERFEKALKAKKTADKSIKAGREYVEAYINYIHYVEGIHTAVMSKGEHHDEGAGPVESKNED